MLLLGHCRRLTKTLPDGELVWLASGTRTVTSSRLGSAGGWLWFRMVPGQGEQLVIEATAAACAAVNAGLHMLTAAPEAHAALHACSIPSVADESDASQPVAGGRPFGGPMVVLRFVPGPAYATSDAADDELPALPLRVGYPSSIRSYRTSIQLYASTLASGSVRDMWGTATA